MSKKQAIAFFEEISKNQQLAQEVERVVEGKDSDEAKAKELISLAQRYNFNFTPEEAAEAQVELKKPLSPEEMLEVSGGKLNLKSSVMAAAMLLGLGATGATLHNMEASAMKRTQPPAGSPIIGGKCPKIDPPNSAPQGNPLFVEAIMRYVQGLSAETNETQQQTTPQLAGATTPEQGETSPGEQEAQTRGTPQERKVRKNVEHDKKAAERYSGVDGCGKAQVEWARRVSASGAVPAADWPAAPTANLEAEKEHCRFCGGTLSARGKTALDVKCSNDGCIYNWVFPATGDAKLKGNQRGQFDYGHYVRWALLPALILDSRLPTVGRGTNQRPRPADIMTPAEAWAVWQLISQRRPNGTWPDIERMMRAHNVAQGTQDKVIRLLEASYANLAHGNEHFAADFGSEIQELVNGHNNGWRDIQATMDQRGYDDTAVDTAIERMEHAYNMLDDNQLDAAMIDPATVERNPSSTLDNIMTALRPRLEAAAAEEEEEEEEARRQREAEKEAARRKAIEKLQHKEKLSIDEAKAIAPILKCTTCGNIGAYAQEKNGKFYFRCKNKGCRKGFSNKPADILAMLRGEPVDTSSTQLWIEAWQRGERRCPRCSGANVKRHGRNGLKYLCKDCKEKSGGRGGYFTVTKATIPSAENEAPMQFETPPIQMDQEARPALGTNFTSPTMPQTSMQGMNRSNPEQQMMTQQNMLAMGMDDDDFNIYAYDDDENDNPNVPREEKEQPEDYENPEPYNSRPGMMGYPDRQQQPFQQPIQMMNTNGAGFNFSGQGMNQFNHGQQMMTHNHNDLDNTFYYEPIEPYQLQTEGHNDFTFNMESNHVPIHRHLIVYQMDGPQQPVNAQMQNMDQMNGQLQTMQNMNQMNNQPQNAQVDQNQQPVTYQPELNFDPTQILQQPAAQQNGTQPQQNLIQQPILNLDLHYDPVGKYVNALNTDTQELAQYTGMLLELINTGQAANVAQIVEVEIAAQTVVNRVFARELQDQANQIILNTLGADNRYLEAEQAFTDQLKRFNNVLDIIDKSWK